jgi:cyanophycin synthetase
MKFAKVLALRGPNLWANFPVLEAAIELGPWRDRPSHTLPGFNDRLLSWMPTLATHRCNLGVLGGFVTELKEGTSLAHAVAHVALELQSLAGQPVTFNRVCETAEPGRFKVAVEYTEEVLARDCLETAHKIVLAAAEDRPHDVAGDVKRLTDAAYDACLGPSTGSIVAAAKGLGVPTRRLTAGSMVMLGQGHKQRRICTAETDGTSAIAEQIAQDKELTRKLLKVVGVPVPEGRPVESAEDAWEAADDIGVPVVVKPQYGNHGRGVATNLTTKEQVLAAYAAARREGSSIVVEKYAPGRDYRILVVNYKVVAAARRDPPRVFGDGVHTIAQLVEQVNRDPRRSDGHSTSLSIIKLDTIALAVLAEQGFTSESVPPAGMEVIIRRNANLSTGGTATDVTDIMHPSVAEQAVDAARAVGLDIAGIDVICEDITRPLTEQGGIVCEVNAGPGLRMHLDPSEGKPRPVGEAIVDMLFPDEGNGRIPIVAVTGVNGKTTTTRLIAHILGVMYKTVGFTCTDGIYVNHRRIDTGDCSGPKSAGAVLMNPAVEAAVFETARGGILREGLGFDQCSVAVVTNIGEGDHLGLSDIHTLDDLARVKRVIVDVVPKTGAAVLNASDPLVAAMAKHCAGSVVYFSRDPNHPLLTQRRAEGGRVAFERDNSVVLADGPSEFSLLSFDRIPITHGGKVGFQCENVLAAAAACWAQGIPAEVIRTGLETFGATLGKSPGRFNLMDINGATVVVDYGHNTSSLQAMLEIIQQFPHKRRLALYSAAGDRRDIDLVQQGELLGKAFDRVFIYEDHYLRGRQPGEIMQLFEQGLKKSARVTEMRSITGWKTACAEVIAAAQPGELVLMQADVVDETVQHLRDLAATTDIIIREITLADAMQVVPPAEVEAPRKSGE